ncbi:maleylpyruvate isomerase N-terminal domain-containing protein [Streptomyces sp. AC536]|uniref:maleylpyruvate isomerase N-terminal domain-containing protein n=1 Tax=Streptomyces buecherae TaxID=2763006 RepID=UPI00164E96EC|nr:maleylpyruvate isomerase N-terminal domain-containing protein [Streptomyces buecherae]MBC3987193.1 maleylpyruvate isomerase N-terminal domain-containing protein [Streptomyces buecherae]QNJ43710.1 maleylpyruvate isomerase N-terminal domain-containing protein [Streptomyces buecherae]
MGAVTRFDPVAEHARTRAALGDAIPRLVRLVRAVPDLDVASGVPVWTVGDVGAHLAAVYLAYHAVAHPDASVEWGRIVPPGETSLSERVGAVNAASIGLLSREERARLGALLAERGETFLRDTEDLPPDTLVHAPWLGREITVATATGLVLSETLVHGLDIARGARLPWSIGPDAARLVLGQSMPTMMRMALDASRARGVSIAFDLAIKGGPRLAAVVDDGTMTVTRDAPPRAYDCRITATPTAFLLVSFRRTPTWKAVARGRLRASGRRPWLARQLGLLVASP